MIRNLVAVAMMIGLGLAAWSVWLQLDRPVHSVRVEGTLTAAEQEAIRAVVSERLEQGVLSLDLEAITAGIRRLSWPRSVAVRRVWPDGLVIRVEKESVVAAWGAGGYLNSAGKVVQLADGIDGVPALATALSTPRRAMEIYQMLESRVQAAGLSIERLEENALGEWLMTLNTGTSVAFGNEALSVRLDRVLRAYARGLDERRDEIAHIDARYDNGVAVRWKETGTEYALR